uniref:NADH-ubiquinone oxidoreductase chain 1 n=1 Tax=Furcilarnaca wufengensis TaxID=2982682 RepID=A0A977XKE2_9ORTH|nr:NADH dehydrogenase subunit 1 [Furcilarnaca wufengensis]UXP34265.1 NADH dehydrogenase subunit 1 [Furcilarnaca wufengensis]UXP34347.1 NADH dehydrogenase subunit 1 [Furcilarnaca wufengensis]
MWIEVVVNLISSLMMVVCVLVGVAFLTLMERKILGYIQVRKGPNKVGVAGVPQPFADAIKLFSSEQTYPVLSNYIMYYFCPVGSLMLSLLGWMVFPYLTFLFSFNFGLLFFLCCTSLGVYTVMIAGWASNSKYALLGGLRAVAQTISYEVSLALILFSFIFLIDSYCLGMFFYYQEYIWLIMLSLPLSLAWFASCLAETNRTPFDFAEGESELVSGFNVEYSSGGFALIFMAEYASILFMSMLFCVMFLGCDVNSLGFFVSLVGVSFIFVWVRGTLPRFRYDKLMFLAWKSFLPLSLNFLIFYVGFKLLTMSIGI